MKSSPYELTIEQEFKIRLMEESAQQMTRDQMQDLLMQSAKLLMIKDNLIKELIRSCLV